jgi:hypothetical protein
MGNMKQVALVMEQCNVTQSQAITMIMEDRKKVMDEEREQRRDDMEMAKEREDKIESIKSNLELAITELEIHLEAYGNNLRVETARNRLKVARETIWEMGLR